MSSFGNDYVRTYKEVEIDGHKIANPSANGVQITRELVQSANTRRTTSAKMVGKVVGIKVTYKFSFPASLTKSQIEQIEGLVINKTFKHTMKVVNEFSKVETFDCYFGNYSADQYGFIGDKMMNQSLSFEAVEI
jgi:hypothetical protein